MSERLQTLGAKPQRPLWASTGIKNPAYSDVLYVEQLIAPGVINTMPEGRTLPASASTRSRPNSSEAVDSFCNSYSSLLKRIEVRLATTSA